jgi:hypothetical protein
MKTCWFIVFFSRDQWWIDCEGKSYGPFPSQDEAQREAARLAPIFGDPLRRSLVFAPDDDGRMALVWSEADPAPTGEN